MSELAVVDPQDITTLKDGLIILVTGNDHVRIKEELAQGFLILWPRMQSGPPIRIGRQDDPAEEVPIYPEIDLSPVMPTQTQGCVSRLQAALEWRDEKPMLRTISTVSGTWVRHSGEKHIKFIRLHEYYELKHGDVIYLGHPKNIYVRLRIQFRGSPTPTTTP